jgi:hypothetical protein
MAPRVFYSFHYDADCTRASLVRNIGVIEGNRPATDNEWEQVKRGGDAAIEKWIKAQVAGRSCCVVLIGAETAGRKWISYEISHAWNEGKGVVGVYIHNLKNLNGTQARKGRNPLDHVTFTNSGTRLSSVAKAYDPPYTDSKQVYAYISANLSSWIDEAIRIRKTAQ